jgi:AcrR family transcriptional regulator
MSTISDKPSHPTRTALLSATSALVDEGGPSAVTMRAVGARAGVSRAAPYKYFADRAALMAAVVTADLAGFATMLEGDSPSGSTAIEALRAVAVRFVRFAGEHPRRYELMVGEALASATGHPDVLAASHRAFTALGSAVGRCLAGSDRAEIDRATMILYAGLHGLVHLRFTGVVYDVKGFDLEQLAVELTDSLMRRG